MPTTYLRCGNARWLSVFLLLISCISSNAASDIQYTRHLQSRLIAADVAAQPGHTVLLGLLMEHEPHWHTYWKNPGDSGLKTVIEMSAADGVIFHGIDWPAPQRFELGDLVNFGYSDRIVLPLRVTVPRDMVGHTLQLTFNARWLICETECIPDKAQYTVQLPLARDSDVQPDQRWQADFARAAKRQPRTVDLGATVTTNDTNVRLTVRGDDVPRNLKQWTLFPVAEALVAFGPRPQWQSRNRQWQATLQRSTYFTALPADSEWWLVNGETALRFVARGVIEKASVDNH